VIGNSITLTVGDSAVCTVNNDDIPPQLHLRKVVVNDNGGTATVANFVLTGNGTGANDISGTSRSIRVLDCWPIRSHSAKQVRAVIPRRLGSASEVLRTGRTSRSA
jgi:hypothetical protein